MQPLSWTVLEFEKKDRRPDWVWTVGLVALLAAVVSFFYGNIFFGILLIVAGAVTIIYALKHPDELAVTIGQDGVSVNETLMPYKDMQAFWLDETGKQVKLLVLMKSTFIPLHAIPVEGVETEKVRAALAPFAKEEELRESRSIALFDRLGF